MGGIFSGSQKLLGLSPPNYKSVKPWSDTTRIFVCFFIKFVTNIIRVNRNYTVQTRTETK